VEATVATFTLTEKTLPNDAKEVRANPAQQSEGDRLLIVDRPLIDQNGNQRGSFVLCGTCLRIFPAAPNNDVLMSFQVSNTFPEGVINTQGAIRFSEIAGGVTFAIVGGTGVYEKARGTVTNKAGMFTFEVL
jgi:hypothetical protein